jgi:uncharacterized protein affecting Mg2+/Co2+ transport
MFACLISSTSSISLPYPAALKTYMLLCLFAAHAVLPQEQQLPLTLQGLKQLIRDNFKAHAIQPHAADAEPQQQQGSGRTSSQQHLSPLDQGFAALRALPQQVYLEACSSSSNTDGILIEATSCHNPRADPFASAGVVVGGSSSREQWFSYRIRITNNRRHCIKVLGRGWVIESHIGELEGFVNLAPDNGVVGQQPVIPPGACFEYYSCSSLKRSDAPGTMQGHLLVSLLGPAEQQQQQQATAEDSAAAAAAGDSPSSEPLQQQQRQDEASSSSSNRRRAAASDEVELERVAMPVGLIRLQSPATAAAAVQDARSKASSSAERQTGEQAGVVAACGAAAKQVGEVGGSSSSSSRGGGADSGSGSSSSDDDSSQR